MRLLPLLWLLSLPLTSQTRKAINVFSGDEVIPQFVAGGGWRTSVTLVNMSDTAASFPVEFFTDAGQPLRVPIETLGNVTGVQITLPSKQTMTFSTGDLPDLVQGWAFADLPTGQRIGGFATFRQRAPGRPDFEAVVPISSQFEDHSFLLFDNTAGFSTGISLVNPSRSTITTVTVNVRDENGNRLLLDQFSLPVRTKQVFSMPDRWRESAGKRGSIEISATPGDFVVLGLRFNPGGAFTSFHSLEP